MTIADPIYTSPDPDRHYTSRGEVFRRAATGSALSAQIISSEGRPSGVLRGKVDVSLCPLAAGQRCLPLQISASRPADLRSDRVGKVRQGTCTMRVSGGVVVRADTGDEVIQLGQLLCDAIATWESFLEGRGVI